MNRDLAGVLARLGAMAMLVLMIPSLAMAAPTGSHPGRTPAFALAKPAVSDLDPAPVVALAKQVDDAEAEIDTLSLHARSADLSDGELRARIAAIPPIQAKLADALDNLNPRLKSADARLEQLGTAPAAGEPPEAPETTQSRQEILRYRQSVDTEVKQARLLATEADQLNANLSDQRRNLFSRRMRVHGRSMLDPQIWIDFARQAPGDLGKLKDVLDQEWALLAMKAGSASAGFLWALAGVVAALLVAPARVLLNRWAETRLEPKGGQTRPALIAVWWIAAAGLTPLAVSVAMQRALSGAGAATPLFAQILALFWSAVIFGSLVEGVAGALLFARRPAWRVVPISNAAARRLKPFPALIGLSAALTGFVTGLSSLLGLGGATGEAASCLTLLVQLIVIAAALSESGRARVIDAEAASDADRPAIGLPWIVAAMLAWLVLSCAAVGIATGYLAFATFAVRELVWAGALLGAIFILMRGVDAAVAWLVSPGRPIGRAIRISVGLSALGVEQVGELLSGLARLGLLLAGWTAILAPLGADAQDVFGRITSADLVLRLGQVAISPGAIAGALLVLGVGLVATQIVRRWLEARYFPKTRMDAGLQTSLASGTTYLGVLIAILFTCAYLGVSFDRLALLASALSVGIGFGLQAVIGNFVSGLILLAERPVKVGDWIAIGDMEGDIRRINVRATEIEMADHSHLIVPNSELVTKTVRNVTHGGNLGRVKIVLALDSASDPLVVRDLLLRHLQSHPDALAAPPAGVYMTDIKEGALEFTAYVYLGSPRQAFRTKSDLLFAILPDLRVHGIRLATSSPVVHLDLVDPSLAPGGERP